MFLGTHILCIKKGSELLPFLLVLHLALANVRVVTPLSILLSCCEELVSLCREGLLE